MNSKHVLYLLCLIKLFSYLDGQPNKYLHGEYTSVENQPWIVSIQVKVDKVFEHVCVGTAIHTNWILTSAGCIAMLPSTNSPKGYIVGGATYTNECRERIAIKETYSHPEYGKSKQYTKNYRFRITPNDIGLIKTTKAMHVCTSYPKMIRLWRDSSSSPVTSLEISGWGGVGVYDNNNHTKQMRTLLMEPIVRSFCYRTIPLDFDDNDLTEVEKKNNSTLTTYGDDCLRTMAQFPGEPGSPVVFKADKPYQVSIVSSLQDANSSSATVNPKVYTLVAPFFPWLKEIIKTHTNRDTIDKIPSNDVETSTTASTSDSTSPQSIAIEQFVPTTKVQSTFSSESSTEMDQTKGQPITSENQQDTSTTAPVEDATTFGKIDPNVHPFHVSTDEIPKWTSPMNRIHMIARPPISNHYFGPQRKKRIVY